MDRFEAMSAFVRVVEAGSFTKAAETLDLPKPTVTRLIQGLERDLRVRLLDRTTRSVTTTAEGANYYERVVRLLSDLADIESTAQQSLARPSGRLRVDLAAAIATTIIVPALPQFFKAYPDIQLELGIGNRQTDLMVDNVDCVIRAGTVDVESLVARRIGEFQLVTCAAPDYLAAHGTPRTMGDLDDRHCLIGLVSTVTGKPIPFRFFQGSERVQIDLPARLSMDDTNALLVAGVAGLGILQAPAYVVQSALASGHLVPVLDDLGTQTVPVHVLYRPNRFLSAKVRAFIDWAVAVFERNPRLKLD